MRKFREYSVTQNWKLDLRLLSRVCSGASLMFLLLSLEVNFLNDLALLLPHLSAEFIYLGPLYRKYKA